jgi:hypothetical protein
MKGAIFAWFEARAGSQLTTFSKRFGVAAAIVATWKVDWF